MAAVVRSIGVDAAHVDDVVHDAFVLACGKPEIERPDPKDDVAFGAWLCTLAKYAAKTNRRNASRSREMSAPAEDIELVAEEKDAYLGPFEDRVIASTVFERLSRDDGALLHEHFYEDKDIKDLADEHGIPWSTMRSRVDCVLDRARIAVRDVAPRSGRRRRAWAIPLALLGFAAREARAHVGSLWVRFFGALRRGPARLIGFGATAAVILAATPDSGLHAADGFATGGKNIQSTGYEDAARCADLVRSTLASLQEAPKPTVPRNTKASPPRRYEQRSTSVWMIANAIRDAEAQAK
ncbi:sigma-70 family RNA polymerase sigma factor [Polyangium sp. y55x31]|uniref:RNA polymerase sigma factor n=1 Tax=Polyangium sp. y55x31 TaxID=3042688 RepID=UPI0032B17183